MVSTCDLQSLPWTTEQNWSVKSQLLFMKQDTLKKFPLQNSPWDDVEAGTSFEMTSLLFSFPFSISSREHLLTNNLHMNLHLRVDFCRNWQKIHSRRWEFRTWRMGLKSNPRHTNSVLSLGCFSSLLIVQSSIFLCVVENFLKRPPLVLLTNFNLPMVPPCYV